MTTNPDDELFMKAIQSSLSAGQLRAVEADDPRVFRGLQRAADHHSLRSSEAISAWLALRRE